jgi:(E)-4-hydroxy-3-methylbut-2-enyl-diphosphate synthase
MLSKSTVIKIGSEFIGGSHRVSVQSMTNTKTLDTTATVNQIERIYKEGCDIIRLTVRDIREAENLKVIKSELSKLGIEIPLVADIHFNTKVAEVAAKYVDKVRINPGNYVDKRRLKEAFSESEYILEQNKIAQRLKPLIDICTEYKTAIRIGTNLGSLSERILFRYGNTAKGMVESALEFIEVCRKFDFHNLVLSMKASHVPSMLKATRLLVEEMNKRGYYYPLHLGVTEAGDGDEGRIKAAAGIGSLLADGIGDTIRVSLTEDPENEVVYGNKLLSKYAKRTKLAFDSKLHKDPKTKDYKLSYKNLSEEDLLVKASIDFTRQYSHNKVKEVKILNDNIENNLLSDKIL